jgi:hypothetical protein
MEKKYYETARNIHTRVRIVHTYYTYMYIHTYIIHTYIIHTYIYIEIGMYNYVDMKEKNNQTCYIFKFKTIIFFLLWSAFNYILRVLVFF